MFVMSTKKTSSTRKSHEISNRAQKSFILNALREKYCRGSSVAPASEVRNDRSSPILRSKESNCDGIGPGSKMFLKKSSFRDVVLRAAQHKSLRENLDSKSKRRLSDLGHHARLQRFRQIASRWKTKSMKGTCAKETFTESGFEILIPEKPRFCATLSTEAQYATFKGYEDALFHKLSSYFPSSTGTVPITRIPSAKSKPRPSNEKMASFASLENKPTIVLSSLKEPEKYFPQSAKQYRREYDHNRRYISGYFQQAMNLLDELKVKQNSFIEQEAKQANVILEKNIKQYHAWSRQWMKHFEFSC